MSDIFMIIGLVTLQAIGVGAVLAGAVAYSKNHSRNHETILEDCLEAQYTSYLEGLQEMRERKREALEQLEASCESMDDRRKKTVALILDSYEQNISSIDEAFEKAASTPDLMSINLAAMSQGTVVIDEQFVEFIEEVRHYVTPEEHEEKIQACIQTIAESQGSDAPSDTQKSESPSPTVSDMIQSLSEPRSPENIETLVRECEQTLDEIRSRLEEPDIQREQRATFERQAFFTEQIVQFMGGKKRLVEKETEIAETIEQIELESKEKEDAQLSYSKDQEKMGRQSKQIKDLKREVQDLKSQLSEAQLRMRKAGLIDVSRGEIAKADAPITDIHHFDRKELVRTREQLKEAQTIVQGQQQEIEQVKMECVKYQAEYERLFEIMASVDSSPSLSAGGADEAPVSEEIQTI